jgi:antibiotic biosynthesis monooxygenase (ABM) superfamily enzyme
MLDLGLRSLQSLTLKDLVYLLLGMATWIAAVVLIGFDVMVVAVIVWYVVPIVVELGRRAWLWVRSRRVGVDDEPT